VGNDKLSNSIYFICCPTPTHEYALAASVLLRTITTDAATIKRWAILDSGATSHFLTTDAPATNIAPADVPLIARLPNRGSSPRAPAIFFQKILAIALSQNFENLGGDMARQCIKNLTTPIFDITPPQRLS